jgi:AGCS family alanine or glycine:cation symporter
VLLIPVGAVIQLRLVWDIAGIFNGLMAFPNLVALLGLSGVLARMVRDYDNRLPGMRPYRKDHDLWFLRLFRRRS